MLYPKEKHNPISIKTTNIDIQQLTKQNLNKIRVTKPTAKQNIR